MTRRPVINPPDNFVWVRFRTKHGSGPGEWQWREYNLAGAPGKTPRALEAFFLKNFAEELSDEHNTHHDGWRGVEFEVKPIPAHILMRWVEGDEVRILIAKKAQKRHIDQLNDAPVVDTDAPTKRPCREWPQCGCLVQGKRKDCRAPYKPMVTR